MVAQSICGNTLNLRKMNTVEASPNQPDSSKTPVISSTGMNKTIVITYDDATRMVDFCKDNKDVVSKDFYDWYLKEKPEFFAKTGMLIIDNILKKGERCAIAFDVTNPNEASFTAYVYKDQTVICNWIFKRQDNLTMKDVSFDIKYFSINNLKKDSLFYPDKTKNLVEDIVGEIDFKKTHRAGFRNTSKKDLIQKTLNNGLKKINEKKCQLFIYLTYALMYYVTKQTPEEITSVFNKELDKELGEANKVKAIYKYTGYIDLRENKVYKPIIKKDPDEPVREYERHIQKWTVRGHYRKTNSGLIWIEPHIKGQGELEKRIYSTEDEKDLNLRPKVFEVERTVKERPEIKIDIAEQKKEELKSIEVIIEVPINVKQKKVNIFRRLLKLFGW